MKIVIWGNELTAWVTAAALAQAGNDIYLVSNSQITDPITLMGSSIHNEPGLRDLVVDGFEQKRIRLVQTRTDNATNSSCAINHVSHTFPDCKKTGPDNYQRNSSG